MIPRVKDNLSSQGSHSTAVEDVLLRLARESLGVSDVSPADDLFTLRGASVGIAILTIQIEEHFNIELPLVSIFEFPTLAELAAEVQRLVDAQRR